MTNIEHWLIQGDNLPVMQALLPAYKGLVDVIYIDPPYNTGHHTLTYKDQHADWAAMMRPRLQMASELLSDKGVIAISIDQHELFTLGALCNEVFGGDHCLGVITVVNNMKGRSDGRHFSVCNEFMLFYAINPTKVNMNLIPLTEEEVDNEYHHNDNKGAYKLTNFRKTGKEWQRECRPTMYYPLLFRDGAFHAITDSEHAHIYKNGKFNDKYVEQLTRRYQQEGYNVFLPLDEKGRKGRWRWAFHDTYKKCYSTELELNRANTPCVKMRARLEDGSLRGKLSKTTWYKAEYDTGVATRQVADILGQHAFNNPKAVEHIKDVLRLFASDALVLDFFAGSGTTLHAALELNKEDGGTRRCILITNNENGICEEITLPRCQRIIEGYQRSNGTWVEGLKGNSLRYFPTYSQILK